MELREGIPLVDAMGFSISRGPSGLMDQFVPAGQFGFELIRGGKLIRKSAFKNTIVDQGKNSLLDVGFRNQAQLTAWYFGIVDNNGWTSFSTADTAASHAGWTEFTTYTEATRQAWSPGAAASASITNGTVATFNITGTGTLKGAFIISNSTKSGTSGTLWSEAAFSGGTVSVANGDQLRLTYTLSC